MMKVQTYLEEDIFSAIGIDILDDAQRSRQERAEAALEALKEDLGIKYKLYDDRVVLNYNQIESPKTNEIVMECRGLILSFPKFEVMARGFDRFFNHGEAPEFTEQVDFSRSVVYEKADGSYISVYHDGSEWCIATRGTAFAECENYSGRIFKDMVAEAFGCDVNDVFEKAGILTHYTFIFEFTSPQNRVVTRYEKPEMVLTGVRNRDDGDFVPDLALQLCLHGLVKAGYINLRPAKKFDISTPEAALQAARELKDLQEGYVVYDRVSGARVKIKSPTYVAVHHIKGEGLTPKRMALLVTCGEVDEYLGYFPEDAFQLVPYINSLDHMLHDAEAKWLDTMFISDQKEFAMEVKDGVQSALLFSAKRNRSTPSHEFNLQGDAFKVRMLLKFMGL